MKSRHRVWWLALCLSHLFMSAVVQGQQLEWIRQSGSTGLDESYGVSADTLGNVYITGFTSGGLDEPCIFCAFVSKYDSFGNLQWTRQLETMRLEESHGVFADSLGNVYISGFTYGSLEGANAGITDAFVSKYDASGNLKWTRQLGTVSADESFGVSADSLGNVYISGRTKGSLGAPNAGFNWDAFVSKFDASGDLQWTRQLGAGFDRDESYGVSADSLGNVYISGQTDGRLGGPNAGIRDDAFLTKYDTLGNLQWTRQLGTTAFDYSYGVSTDSLGNVYISGASYGGLGGPNISDRPDAFVAKYDASGNLQWTRQLGTSADDWSFGVSTDSLGNVYISGFTDGSLDGPNAGSWDTYVAKYDASGNLQWTRQLGTPADDRSFGVSADSFGNVFISGYTFGSLGGPNAGGRDLFLAKFSTTPEPSTLFLATLASVFLLTQRARPSPFSATCEFPSISMKKQ